MYTLLRQEACLLMRQKGKILNAFLLYLMMMFFLPLTMPADASYLHPIFSSLWWIALLFTFFLSAEHFFYDEIESGILEQWFISDIPLHHRLRIKILVFWFFHVLPILISIPLILLIFNESFSFIWPLSLVLVCSTPAVFCFCALAAAFSCGTKQKGAFMALIILPLTLPMMVLGSAAVRAMQHHLPFVAELALLLAISLFSLLVMPWVMGYALKLTLD